MAKNNDIKNRIEEIRKARELKDLEKGKLNIKENGKGQIIISNVQA